MSYIAVVTGATRGLGRGIAREFGAKGATVIVTGRNKTDLADVSAGGVTGQTDGQLELRTLARLAAAPNNAPRFVLGNFAHALALASHRIARAPLEGTPRPRAAPP